MKIIIERIWEYIRFNPKKFFFQVAFSLFIVWIFIDDYGILKRIHMEAEYRTLLEQDRVEQKKIRDNELRIQHAHEPDSIEKAAREKYNYRKQGETLFIIRTH